jgi:hypothetical protein
MSKAQLNIKTKHRIEGQTVLKVNAPLFLAWKIHKQSLNMEWPATLSLIDAVDLAFYVAKVTHQTMYEDKERWLKGVYSFEAKFTKGRFG